MSQTPEDLERRVDMIVSKLGSLDRRLEALERDGSVPRTAYMENPRRSDYEREIASLEAERDRLRAEVEDLRDGSRALKVERLVKRERAT